MDLNALKDLIRSDRAAAGTALDDALQAKHGTGDPRTMLSLHLLAAEYWSSDTHQAAFHRTHAYVYALEAGDWHRANRLFDDLEKDGRI